MAKTTRDFPELWNDILDPSINLPAPHRLLFIDDNPNQLDRLCQKIDNKWLIGITETPDDGFRKLEEISKHPKRTENVVVSIDLVFDSEGYENTKLGLDLLQRIRKEWDTLPIIVHSGFALKNPPTIHILAQKGSFILLREDTKETAIYASVLDYILAGCVIFSRTPAEDLKDMVNLPIDPFAGNPEWWCTLAHLYDGLTFEKIGELEDVVLGAIADRVKRIVGKLQLLGELPPADETNRPRNYYRDTALKWYRANLKRAEFYMRQIDCPRSVKDD